MTQPTLDMRQPNADPERWSAYSSAYLQATCQFRWIEPRTRQVPPGVSKMQLDSDLNRLLYVPAKASY
ncbi:MAG: hypothetical protein AAB427_02580, partial [Chloroflexota bacterium]